MMSMRDKANRYIVNEGIKVINSSDSFRWKSLRNLFKSTLYDGKFYSGDFSFKIGPLINSAGRLLDAQVGSNFLSATESTSENKKLLSTLVSMNKDRKFRQETMTITLRRQIAEQREMKYGGMVVVAIGDMYDYGLTGPVSSRISGDNKVPVITLIDNGIDPYKGSCRSYGGLHLKNYLDRLQSNFDIFHKYGGHSGAAGVEVKRDKLDILIEEFGKIRLLDGRKSDIIEEDDSDNIAQLAPGREYVKVGEMSTDNTQVKDEIFVINWRGDLMSKIRALGPFGKDWKEPKVIFNCTIRKAFQDRNNKHGIYHFMTGNRYMVNGFHYNVGSNFVHPKINQEAQVVGSISSPSKIFIESIDFEVPF